MKVRVRKSAESAASAAPEGDTTPTNRLTDITVNEVSIVDRAANKRSFLVVKDAAPGQPPVPAPAPAVPPAPGTPPPASSLKLSPEVKTQVVGLLQKAMEKISLISKALEGAVEAPGAVMPPELTTALASVGDLFDAVSPAAPPVAAPAPAHAAPPVVPAQKDETEKAGRKISSARQKLLNDAKTALDAVLADVSESTEEEAPKTETEKSGSTETVVAPAPSAEIVEIKAALTTLGDVIGKMTKVFEAQNKSLEALSKSKGSSNQVDLDKETVKKGAEVVVWDMDMARTKKATQ